MVPDPEHIAVRPGDVVTLRPGVVYSVSLATATGGQWPTRQLDYLMSSPLNSLNLLQRDAPKRSHHDHLITRHIRRHQRASRR